MVDLSRFPRRKDAGPVATPQSTDPYAQVISRMSGGPARANLLDDSTSPADAIQAKQLSRRMGMPAEAISADTKGFSAEDGLKAWNDVIDSSPGLRQFLGNSPLNAAAARDDREALANVSQTFQTADQAGDPLGQRYLGQLRQQLRGTSVLGGARPAAPIMDAFKRGVTDTISRKLAGDPNAGMLAPDPLQGGRAATVGNIATGHAANFVYNLNAPLLGAGRYLADTLGIGDQFAQSDYVIQKQRQLEELQAFGDVRYTPMGHAFGMELNPGQWAYSAADSLAQMGAAFTTGQPLTVLSMGTGLEFYNRARARGAGATESAFGAAATGAIEAATELLPLDYLEHNFGKKAIGKFLIGYLPKEVGGELLATVGQNAADALVTGGVGWDQYLKSLPQDLLDTAGSTLFMGGMLGALNKVAQRSQPEARTMLDIGRATAGAAWVDQLMTNSAESKLRAADPETFKEFVDTHTQDSPVRNLYVPVEAIRALQQSEGYEPGFFERFQDQIDQAEATQGDVVIPISEAASELAGTPQWEAIKDQTRIYPGGLSQKEALAQHDEIMRTLEQRGAEIAKEVAEGTDSPASEVYTEVKNRLLAGGVQSRQAETVAQLYAARYETRASQMGGTAMEQFKAAKIVFPGEQPGSTGGREVAAPEPTPSEPLTPQHLPDSVLGPITSTLVDAPVNPETGDMRIPMTPEEIATLREHGIQVSDSGLLDGVNAEKLMAERDRRVNGGKALERPAAQTMQQSVNPFGGVTLFQSAEDLAQHVPGLDKVLPYLEQDERDRLKKRSAARIVELVDTFPSAEEMASVAFAGRAKRGWYERSAQALLDIFGMEDSSRFAALLAATSPQTSVESNTINALAIWVNWDKAGRPTDEKSIIKIMGKSVQGRKGADSILPAWINNTVRALSADNAADVKLSGPKVNSFMANLVGAVDEVTNDAWMANYALIDQSLFKGTPQKAADGSTIAAKSPGYIAFSALVRRAADILTERTGETWTPAEVQETVWSFTKILTEKRDSAGSIPVDQILAAGGLTHEDIGGTPDFAMLFQRGIYRNILEAGGYGEAVADLEGSAQADGSSGKQGSVTNAEGSGLDPAVFLEHLGTAGGRIEVRVGRERKTTGDQQRDLFAGFNLQPLTGLPGLIKVDGVPVQFGPFGPARESARRYMLRNGYPYSPPTDYVKVDVERAKRIAQAFEEMKHDPEDPQVKAAYRAMIDETVAQYREIEKTGLTVEFIDGEDPYGNPRNAILDVTENNHLWVFPTDTGFGGPSSQAVDISGNPLLEVVPGITISGRPVRANDIFRIVHDYFGHIKEGVGFRADGEENAWRVHSSMYSPLARRAMTTETRGQNSWVNFGPFGEQNQKAGPGDTEYAPQKIGLLPDWVSREGSGLEGRVLNQDVMEVDNRGVTNTPPGRVTVYHGTPYEFDTFKTAGGALWFADTPELAKRYADPRRVRKLGEGRIIPADVTISKPLMVNDDGVVPDGAAWAKEQFGFDLKAHGWERVGQDYSHAVTRSAAFADAARAAGYDAIGRPEGNGMTWGILNKNSVSDPTSGRTLYQGDVFYSAAEKVVADAKQAKATAEQWKALLTPGKTPGIKAEEIEWSGIHDWLDMQEGPISKDVLLQVLQDRGIKIEENVLGAADTEAQSEYRVEERDQNGEPRYDIYYKDNAEPYERGYATREAAQAAISRVTAVPTQFHSWSSDGNNGTYRELLITLPIGQGGNPSRAPSTHWDTESVVAHTRFMEKTDADGKRVLFIEEVQSDWHQKGRDQGYAQGADAARIAALRSEQEALTPRLREVHERFKALSYEAMDTPEGLALEDERRRLILRNTELESEINNAQAKDGIPEAPFKTSWPALVMKRVIRWAVDHGYERVAWTTGAEQSSRYNLSQAVGRIELRGRSDEGNIIRLQSNQASETLIQQGLAKRDEFDTSDLIMSNEQLKEAFGGDIATKLTSAHSGDTLEGGDLTVGGEGMRAFYDRNLVNITNDIIKRYGVKVGKVGPLEDAPLIRANSALQRAQEKYDEEKRIYGSDIAVTRATRAALEKAKAAVAASREPSNPGFEITDKMRDAARNGFTLFQNPQGPRGSVTFTTAGEKVIQLFDTANASTLLHETSHIWLEELRDDAANPAAPQQVRDDWAKIERWFAEQGQPIQPGIPIPTEAHELFARGGERYFMEGKAPSGVLAGAFKTFRAWLLRIYQVAANLRSPINDDVRGVFDRLLATQDAIDQYKSQAGVEPLFKTATEAGMTDAEFAAYQRSVSDARDEAYDAMLYRTMEAIRRQRTAEGRERRRSVRDGVAAEINAQPQFVALHLLRTGMWLGDPSRPRQDVKLNTGWLIDTFGEDILDKLPRGLPITKGDGVDGDTVAEMVGAESGQQLVHALVGMRAASEALRAEGEKRSLRDRMIEDRTDELMAQRYGDPLNDGSIEEEAVAALNTARQGEVIAQEARQLAKRNPTVTQPLTPYQFAREWAKRVVSQGRVSDVASRMALQRYTRATAKAQRAAEKAILDGDTAEAYKQKQAQLLNHALLAEAKVAAEDVDTIVARMRKLAGRAAMKSVDQDYLDKVHMLLERYDFRPRSQKSIDEAEGFQAWLEGQRAKGFEVHIPPRLENKGDPFSRVSVEELRSLNDLVESLMHLGRTKQTLKIAKQDRDFGEFRDEVAARIRQLPVRKLPEKPINEERRFGASSAAELLKVETIVEELDGGKTGPLHDALILGATEAENLRHKLRQQVLHPIARAYKKLSNKQWARFQEKVTIPELTWNTLNEGDPRLGQPVTMTRSELISVLLNMGNLSNLEKLSKGERWPVATLHAVIQRELTKEDFDFAQLLWDQINSLWPQIVATERELSGVVPEQVVPTPIDTPYGTYAGGYWPVVYDADRWQRAEDLEGKQLDDMFGLKSGVATQKGHTITRTAAFGPIQLSLENVMFAHLEQVVTRLSFSAYARDVLRIVRDKTIRGLIDTHLGPEYRKQIEPWLARQIHNGAVHTKAARYWQRILRQFRVNMTVAAMGFRISTGVAQTVGLTASAQRIGAKYVGVGLKRLALSPIKMAKFVDERSPEMANRMGAVNREVSDVFAKLRGKHSKFTEMQAWAMWHIGMVDRYVVSIPTWLGAHQKGLDQGMTDYEASAYADKEVRLSQGAGSEKDMSAFQSPNNEAMKFFSMFYTPFNVLFNAQWQAVRGLKQGNIRPMIGVTFWWMIASVLGDALLSGDWPENDEGDIDWESFLGWFARNVFFGLFAGIPIARDIASTAENQVAGKYAPPLSTPVSRVWDTVDQSIKDGHRYADTGELPRDPIKKIGNTAAVVTGTPLSQLGTTGQFAWDYATGEANPQSVSDWYFGITKGKVPANDGSNK